MMRISGRYFFWISMLFWLSPASIFPQDPVIPPSLIRWLDLEGTRNTREMGGYSVPGNASMKWGMIYRSDSLFPLTQADIALLQDRGVRTVIDLRRTWEVASQPDPDSLKAFARYRNFPMEIPGLPTQEAHLLYYVLTGESASSFVKVFQEMSDPNNFPILYHCQRGIDRTGITTALILLLLGVDQETILADYFLSVEAYLGTRDCFDCNRWIHALLDKIEQEGGIEAYLEQRGIDSSLQTAVRSNLLQVESPVEYWMVHE